MVGWISRCTTEPFVGIGLDCVQDFRDHSGELLRALLCFLYADSRGKISMRVISDVLIPPADPVMEDVVAIFKGKIKDVVIW